MLANTVFLCFLPFGADSTTSRSFETHIRPLLEKHCISCHGPDKQKGGLRLDSAQSMAKGGDNGPVLSRDHPEKGLFLQVVRYEGEIKMPPTGKLKPAELAYLEQWIKTGANWPEIQKPNPSVASGETTQKPLPWWARKAASITGKVSAKNGNAIDEFLEKARRATGVKAAPPADRRTLLRRLSFDLTGLPPTLTEIRAFEADPSLDAFSRQVDRLLASDAYGEKWGRRWLDVARYADSNGMDENLAHGPAWRYRDWVIQALNKDLPYDQFLTWQIAGDLLAPVSSDDLMKQRITATGFLTIGPKMLAEDDPVKMRMDIVDEQIDTIGQAFMGLTLGCARCHDHKYDPISTADYYRLAGIFKSTDTMETYSVVARWMERPLLGPSEENQIVIEKAELDKARKSLESERKKARSKRLKEERTKSQEYLTASKLWLESEPLRATSQPRANSLIVEAEDYLKGNVLKDKETYGVGIGVLVNRGELPNFTEYSVKLDQPGFYRVWIRYAAAEARPFRVQLGGKVLNPLAGDKATGSWTPETQKWFSVGIVPSSQGPVPFRLDRDGPFPHIDKIAFEHHAQLPMEALDEVAFAKNRGLAPSLLKRFVELRAHNLSLSETDLKKTFDESFATFFKDDDSLDTLIGEKQSDELNRKKKELDERQKKWDSIEKVMAVKDGKVEDVPIHIRGNHMTLGRVVNRGFPEVFQKGNQNPLSSNQSGRLEMARWMTSPDHPLTARVMVNRIWQGHFGTGLVRSVDNFGNLGEPPSHPELLDWLAGEFVRRGWSIKEMHRLILNSDSWKQSTRWDADFHLKDPDNRLLWRMDRRRLNAEEFRDAMLAVSGKLDRKGGGTLLGVANRNYVTSTANLAYSTYSVAKRSVYLPVVRSALYDFFQVFDFPDPSAMHGERSFTVVPSQALFLLNGKLLDESATALAQQMKPVGPGEAQKAVTRLIEELYGRSPRDGEWERINGFLGRHPADPWKGLCRVLLSSNEFLYLD